MENFELIKAIIILILLVIFTILYGLSLFNNIKYVVPQVSTFKSDFLILEKGLEKYNLKGKKIVDLGSGIGKAIRFFEKKFKMESTGYEIDFSNTLIAKILNKIFSYNSKVIKGNYFKADLKKYDFIYVYLFPELMEKVEEKIWKDAKKGTIVFVNAFNFKNKEEIDIFYKNGKKKIYVYKI
ncbi:MAG: class I SAM-dependent methyltransferase [Candidatus Gracilibacteria bacterium]|nr:class I SAM-dependent methyltransferase [Candidatus Gracilibacteria bacterium]MDQ7022928.1 class I SAM-dependent methyltransferase [Candidatus Gracilibacteria bacterium]